MKKMILGVLLCLTALTATACGSEGGTGFESWNTVSSVEYPLMTDTVTTEDGRTVQCVYMFSSLGVAISCDWGNAQ